MKKVRRGKIDISKLNVPPEKHEYETARYFADRGFDVIFIRSSNIKGMNSPKTLLVITRDGRLLTIKGSFDIIKL